MERKVGLALSLDEGGASDHDDLWVSSYSCLQANFRDLGKSAFLV